jgi:hypothetical protein
MLLFLLNSVKTTQVEATLIVLDALTDVLGIPIGIIRRNTGTIASDTVTTRLYFETELDDMVRQIRTFFLFSGGYSRYVVIIEGKEGLIFSAIFPICTSKRSGRSKPGRGIVLQHLYLRIYKVI